MIKKTYLVSILNEPNERDQIVNQIKVIESDISILKKRLDEQNNLAREHIETRNRFNEIRRSKLNEVQTLKEKRNHFNDYVKDQKNLLIKKRESINENLLEIQKHRQVMKDTLFNVKMSKNEVQSQIDELDWKIQTNPTNMEEEKKIASEIKELHILVEKYSRLESNKKEIQRLYLEIDLLRKEITMLSEQIKNAVNRSQIHHQEMIQRFNDSKEMKNHADKAHKAYLEVKKKANNLRNNLINKQEMLSKLENELRKFNSFEKEVNTEKEKELVNSIVNETQRKIKDGEKVTFDEFKLLLKRDLFKSIKKE